MRAEPDWVTRLRPAVPSYNHRRAIAGAVTMSSSRSSGRTVCGALHHSLGCDDSLCSCHGGRPPRISLHGELAQPAHLLYVIAAPRLCISAHAHAPAYPR